MFQIGKIPVITYTPMTVTMLVNVMLKCFKFPGPWKNILEG